MRGYSLIELLIVIGVLAVLTGLASLSMVSFSKSGDLETSKAIVSSALKEARASSMADTNDKSWGVHFEGLRVVVFSDSGSGYNPEATDNSVRILASNTNLSWELNGGENDIIFYKRTGQTDNFGKAILAGGSPTNLEITINKEGLIE